MMKGKISTGMIIIIMNKTLGTSIPRKLTYTLLTSILVYTLATPHLEVASAQETGRIDVSIEGYDGTSILTAMLINSTLSILENKTINNPSFSFDNLFLGEQYIILLNYKGIEYSSTLIVNQTTQQLTIRVFEPTTSDENIVISLYQISIDRGENYLNITEFIQFDNRGDTVINNTEIKIAIPEGYKNFIWNQNCCLEPADFGIFFRTTEPLMPNRTKTINFKYRLDPSANEFSLVKRFYYETDNVIVTVDSDGLKVVSIENLWSEGLFPVDEQILDVYSAARFFEGEGVSITITGYKSSGLNLLWLGTGILAVLIVGGAVYSFRGSRVSTERLKSQEEALTAVSKQLDKDYANKKITEIEYLKLQLKYKKQLKKVRKRIQKHKNE